jgi:hypothetical protein
LASKPENSPLELRYGGLLGVRQSMVMQPMRRSLVIAGTSALLIGSAVPLAAPTPALSIPTYEGAVDPEIAGVASLRNIEMLDAALDGTWRDRPIGFLIVTTEGWAWTTPGLVCPQASETGFVRAIMDGDSIVVNRTMLDAVNQHNERLASEGDIDAELGCELTRSNY